MAQERRWNMELAARLLQYGATGKAVAEAVGCAPSEISRHKDTLISMVVEPLTQNEADKLLRKKEPFRLESPAPDVAAASLQDYYQAEKAKSAESAIPQKRPVVLEPRSEEEKAATLHRKPEIMVNIDIGKGRVRLEAESAQVLETLINMLVAMGGRE